MAKRKTSKKKELPKYVVLKRLSYKSMIEGEKEIIEPAEDPYAPDARRVTFEHLSEADIQKLVMRKAIAPDRPEEAA